ncbi:MAG: RsmE family RNA methyltransferase, partial [Bifidobacteriaceae bacterium]|nr:RsmE family RNA methyltransferase [Bifidobacteriaceae bacterium]
AQKIKKSNVRDIVIIIGPEGGLTDNEISKFKKSGAEIVDLGSTIYRASFAGAAAVIELKTLLDLDF